MQFFYFQHASIHSLNHFSLRLCVETQKAIFKSKRPQDTRIDQQRKINFAEKIYVKNTFSDKKNLEIFKDIPKKNLP